MYRIIILVGTLICLTSKVAKCYADQSSYSTSNTLPFSFSNVVRIMVQCTVHYQCHFNKHNHVLCLGLTQLVLCKSMDDSG